MNENTKTELGEVKIHKGVIASIATEATKQVPGVLKIGSNLRTGFLELIGKKDATSIKIEFDKNSEATITIPVVVKHDFNIPEVASKVQEGVKMAVENTTSIIIKDVNVNIQEIKKAEA